MCCASKAMKGMVTYMKKIIASVVIVSLLLLNVTVLGATPVSSVQTDMSGYFNGNLSYILTSGGARSGFSGSHNDNNTDTTTEFMMPGNVSSRKGADDQMYVAQLFANGVKNTEWNRGQLDAKDIAYSAGQKLYMRAQYYIPSKSCEGQSYAGYNDNMSVAMVANLSGISANRLITFAPSDSQGGEFRMIGDSKKATETWKYDTWYTVEAIVELGSAVKASVYIDGKPLTLDGGGESVDMLMGGSSTTLSRFYPYSMSSKNMGSAAMKRNIYTDNWAYEVYKSGDEIELWEAPEYNPLSFEGISSGAEIVFYKFKSVQVLTGEEICDSVTLYVNDELVGEKLEAPYLFEMPKRYEPGEVTLRAVAKQGDTEFEYSTKVSLIDYNPLIFKDLTDGTEIIDYKFNSAEVLTGEEQCDSVALYVNDELVGEKFEAPYVFEITKQYNPGNTNLRAVATLGDLVFNRSINVTLVKYNPLSFKGITSGGSLYSSDFESVEVLTGEEVCDSVALYINGELVDEKSEAPYVFEITNRYDPGNITVGAVAKLGNTVFEHSIDVYLVGSYSKPAMNDGFDTYASFYEVQNGGWYSPSSRMHNAKSPNGWFIKPATVKDSAGKFYGTAISLGCNGQSPATWIDSNGGEQSSLILGFCSFSKLMGTGVSTITGNSVDIEWKMYIDNDEIQTFSMGLGTSTNSSLEKVIYKWNPDNKKIEWNVSDSVMSDVVLKKWQQYKMSIDLSGSTPIMSLWVDDELIFEDAQANASFNSFLKIIWHYVPNNEQGSTVALDEIKINHTIPKPSFGTVRFFVDENSKTNSKAVTPLTNAIALTVNNGLIENGLAENVEFLENGKQVVFKNDNGESLNPTVKLYGNQLWIVPAVPLLSDSVYTVVLKADAMFDNNIKIGYDQEFEFTTDSYPTGIKNIEFYINGTKCNNIANASFDKGDKIYAKATFYNNSSSSDDMKLIIAGINGKCVSSLNVTSIDGSSQGSTTVSTGEIEVVSADDFKVSVMLWDSELCYPLVSR